MNVAILGCGYVGLELGQQLTESGHDVVGVRRSHDGVQAIENAGFYSVQADATDEESLSVIPDADTLVYAVSAGGRDSDAARTAYVDGLRTTLSHFSGRDAPPERIVYTSSTGVYSDRDGEWVDESTPLEPKTERQEILAKAEQIVREESGMDWTIARFAGLYGPDRYRLERYLEGSVSERYLNLIHRDDAAGGVRFLLNTDAGRNEIVLVCDDEPIWKPTLVEWLADQCGVEQPPRGEATSERARSSKRCSNEKFHQLGYHLRYPTYRDGYQDAISAYRKTGNI